MEGAKEELIFGGHEKVSNVYSSSRKGREGNDPATVHGVFPPEESAIRNPLPTLHTARMFLSQPPMPPGATYMEEA